MFSQSFFIVCILIIFYIYFIQFRTLSGKTQFFDDIDFDTGDLILFKACNNANAIFIGSYYTHVGIVYKKDGKDYIFEANGIEKMPLREHHNKRGIFVSPLKERVAKYKGYCWVKKLKINKNRMSKGETYYKIAKYNLEKFEEFMHFAVDNFHYEYNVFASALKKFFGIEKCNFGTNCGELVFLSMIMLGLVSPEEYEKNRLHYLIDVCNLTDTGHNGYCYAEPTKIIDHPFAE